MKPSLTDALCTRCGLCCDGSLFADVELASRAEATRLEVMGLEIEDDDTKGALLLQPCRALQGKRCGIYAHRPKCCRTFECRLLQDVRRGTAGVEEARRQIAEALTLIGQVKARMAHLGPRGGHLPLGERCAEALARDPSPVPRVKRRRAELESAMSAVEELLRKTFLGGTRRPHAPRSTGGDAPS
jgi:Fe-S-cluster containining protein